MEKRVLMFFGDSITDGYLLERSEAYPTLIQQKIRKAGLNWQVINEGVSGDESGDGLNRIDEALKVKPDVFVLELGANDGLRETGLPQLKTNLLRILEKVKTRYPEAELVVAGMELPLLFPEETRQIFRSIFVEVARQYDAHLIPFILEGVGGVPGLNMEDGIHPTAKGHVVIAEHVWGCLEGMLRTI